MTRHCILGHRGMVGRAIHRALLARGEQPLTSEVDLRRMDDTRKAAARIANECVETIFMCAGRVGGIKRNMDEPAQMIMENLRMAANVVEMAHSTGAKLVYLGSSCIYPRECPQPMKEESLLTGPLEPTNEPYAIAKIAGIKLCEAYARQYRLKYLALMPCNLYGPYDHFDGDGGHMVPALIKRFVESADKVRERGSHETVSGKTSGDLGIASAYADNGPVGASVSLQTTGDDPSRDSVTVWGTGTPRREIMHVDDFAAAALHLVDRNATGLINVGTGWDMSIRCIAESIATSAGYSGPITFDTTKPDGMPVKVMDITRMKDYKTPKALPFNQRIDETVAWYRENRR